MAISIPKKEGNHLKLIDLSVSLIDGLPVDPPPQIPHINYIDHKVGVPGMLELFPGTTEDDLPDGCGWAVETLSLATHSGTHMDAPWHYHRCHSVQGNRSQKTILSGNPSDSSH